jgi:hypothetical protein
MRRAHLLIIAILLMAATAFAEDVGTVASVRGVAGITRGGAGVPAEVGTVVQLGDELKTGSDGQLRVVFRDDSVIDLGESSTLVVDTQVFNPDAGRYTSLMRLVSGRARALVSQYYKTTGASYHVETPTAVAGVRGTTFVVAYEGDGDTEVVGVDGYVSMEAEHYSRAVTAAPCSCSQAVH